MQSKPNILIIDGDNLCHRAYHKFGALTTSKGESTALLYGFFYVLHSLVKRFNPQHLYIAFDGGRNEHRLKILPGYKDRERSEDFDRENFYKQKEIVRNLCGMLNTHVAWAKGQEADDLIYMILKREIDTAKVYTTIVSSDKDFNQFLGPNVKIFNPFKSAVLTHVSLKKDLGYTPIQFIDFLILDGDKSDKIPGVHGMGEVRIKSFMGTYGSIENYLEAAVTDHSWDKYRPGIVQAYHQNNPLINLRLFYHRYLRGFATPWYPTKSVFFEIKEAQVIGRQYEIQLFNKVDFIETFKNLS
jgi:DNA polymerase I